MRSPIEGDSPPAGRDASECGDDWTARHARTRGSTDGTNVRVDDSAADRDEDWVRRHGRTRGR